MLPEETVRPVASPVQFPYVYDVSGGAPRTGVGVGRGVLLAQGGELFVPVACEDGLLGKGSAHRSAHPGLEVRRDELAEDRF